MTALSKYRKQQLFVGKLPDSGNFVVSTEFPVAAGRTVRIWITQTQQGGHAAGASQFYVELSPDGPETDTPTWYGNTVADPSTLAPLAGVGFSESWDVLVIQLPARTGGCTFVLDTRSARRLRLQLAEYGDKTNQVSLDVWVTLES